MIRSLRSALSIKNNCFSFCSISTASDKQFSLKGRLPLKYNLIYLDPNFAKGKLVNSKPLFVYLLPASGMLTYNILTEWNTINSVSFGALAFGAVLLKFINKQKQMNVHCIQVDETFQNFYLTLNPSMTTFLLSKYYQISKQQLQIFVRYYHPIFQEYPELREIQKIGEYLKANPSIKNTKISAKILRLQSQILRIKVPVDHVQFVPKFNDKNKSIKMFEDVKEVAKSEQKQEQFIKQYSENVEGIHFLLDCSKGKAKMEAQMENKQNKQIPSVTIPLQTKVNYYTVKQMADFLLRTSLYFLIEAQKKDQNIRK